MYLSKSKYCLLWQCPKLLWLEKNRPECKTEDASRDDRMGADQWIPRRYFDTKTN